MNELLILVNENDRQVGLLDKLSVHQRGLLHRAFSVFIFNSNGDLLLQQRAAEKYHSAGLWSNTCCSHPHHGEELPAAVNRRLKEEMGMEAATQFQFSFIYKIDFEDGLKEHEFDHVFFGRSDDLPKPDSSEVKDWKYLSLQKLKEEITYYPENYTAWLKISLPEVMKHFEQK